MLILQFTSEADAAAGLAVINAMAREWWIAQGAPVDEAGLIGRNAATGVPDLAATRTTSWHVVRPGPSGTWWFASLTGVNPAWANWPATYAAAGGPAYLERDVPDTWPD